MKAIPFPRSLLALGLSLFVTTSAKAEITAYSFGIDGIAGPHQISPLDTTIGPVILDNDQYHLLGSSNSNFKFVRHVVSIQDNICYYWFRSNGDPTLYPDTEEYDRVYWYVGNVGETPCTFVDGAQSGDDNFVLLYSDSLKGVVGVLQYALNGANDQNQPARLLAYAVDPNGITFAEGVAAIQHIPEPTSVVLLGLTAAAGALAHRRRK